MDQQIKSIAIDSRNKQEAIECIFATEPYLVCTPFMGAIQPDFLQVVRDLGAPMGRFENSQSQYHLAQATRAAEQRKQSWFGGVFQRDKKQASFDKADWNGEITDGWDGAKVGGHAAAHCAAGELQRCNYYNVLSLYQKDHSTKGDTLRVQTEFECIVAAMGLPKKELEKLKKLARTMKETGLQRHIAITDLQQKQALAFRLAQMFHAKHDGLASVCFAQDSIATWYDTLGFQGSYGEDLFQEYSRLYHEIMLDQHHYFVAAFELRMRIKTNYPQLQFAQGPLANVACGILHSYTYQKEIVQAGMGPEWFKKDPYLTDKPWLYQSAAAQLIALGALSGEQNLQEAIVRELEVDGCDANTIAQLTTLAAGLGKEVLY